MSRCSVVIKFGPRAGRKCRRLNCPYHPTESKDDDDTDIEEPIVEAVEEPVVYPVVEAVEEPAVYPVVEAVEEPVVYPVVDAVEEPVVYPVVEAVEEPVVYPVVEEMLVTQVVESIQEMEVISEEESRAADQVASMVVKSIMDSIVQKHVEEEFVEVTEEDCKEQTDVLVIDTETIGLPPHKSVPMTSVDWERSRAIQIAWKKVLSTGGEICRNYIIRPDGFEVKLTSIHGISQQQAEEKGTPIKDVLKQLREDLKSVVTVVAHNIEFDYQIIAYEFYRSGLTNHWGTAKRECTMALAKKAGMCDGPIRLSVLYEKCFGDLPQGDLHRADVDVELCSRIYSYLTEKMRNRVYFRVEFKDKDVFKFFGGQWDPEKKQWYTYECHRFLGYLRKWFQR